MFSTVDELHPVVTTPPPSLPTRTRFRISYVSTWNTISIDCLIDDPQDRMEGKDFDKEMTKVLEQALFGLDYRGANISMTWKTLSKEETDLAEGFQELAAILSVLGTSEHFPFWDWRSLDIELPQVKIPFDSLTYPVLPVKSFTKLTNLKWAGHPKQICDSWFPITPTLLKNLESLEITCAIPPRIACTFCATPLRLDIYGLTV
ncbi:hypothetical protein H0H92_015750 [Tricholoma furcatifolium]|nr:hypothetical protein H0H92_015750 [Tricholoma furcatifolium]